MNNDRHGEKSSFNSNPMAVIVWVVAALLLAVVMLITVIFLSLAHAEASHGNTAKPLNLFDISGSTGHSGVSNRVATLVWTGPRTAFEGTNPPVEYVLEWPRLPSIEEVEVKIAEAKLAQYVSERAKKAQEARRAVELRLDWEAFWKAVGLSLIILGGFLTFIYGSIRRVFETPSREKKISGNKTGV